MSNRQAKQNRRQFRREYSRLYNNAWKNFLADYMAMSLWEKIVLAFKTSKRKYRKQ